MEQMFLAFRAEGIARPAGSKVSMVPIHPKLELPYWVGSKSCRACFGKAKTTRCTVCKTRRILVNTIDDSEHSQAWKRLVSDFARLAMLKAKASMIDAETVGESGLVPLRFVCRFIQKRPKSHYRTGKFSHILRDDAPDRPTGAPDVLKLGRAIEDALQGVVYKNDSAIVDERLTKHFGADDYVDIEVWQILPDPVVSETRSLFGEVDHVGS